VLQHSNIPYKLLPGTKDIWAVDYMPVQVSKDKFVQFVYNPDYLRNYPKYHKYISDPDSICNSIGLKTTKSDIVVDGGNVVHSADRVIMCDKVFQENPHYEKHALIERLEALLEVSSIIFIPTDPADEIGHADGLVRFVDKDTVLINRYRRPDEMEFAQSLKSAIQRAGLKFIEVPYNPHSNTKPIHANGIYINYLQMSQAIILATFKERPSENEEAVRLFEDVFKGQPLFTIDGSSIAKYGGVLNCITWNIAS
jgi:agmatine deiminase